jgi:biopolymer transport protein ExbB
LPAVLAYNYFLRNLRMRTAELDNFAHDFMRLALKHNFKG